MREAFDLELDYECSIRSTYDTPAECISDRNTDDIGLTATISTHYSISL